jgi:SAM-dependent methyltransferase
MSVASIVEIARAPLPAWFPADSDIERMLAAHQPAYRWRRPSYALQLLKDLALLLPEGGCRVLDVGGGSGLIGQAIAHFFPGKRVTAIDVVDRFLPGVTIEHGTFDGRRIPHADGAFDCALLNNVLHHVPPAMRRPLLAEALRATGGRCVIVKDHLAGSALDHARLAWLDFVGNLPFGGMVRAQYLSAEAWKRLFADTGCFAERFAPAPYRSGLASLAFPNRLEILFRLHSR